MPASLKFVAGLLFLGAIGAVASAFVKYREATSQTRDNAEAITAGNVDAGSAAITRYGCGACHFIPGVTAATGRVGPSLRGVARRAIIGGRLPNNPANLILWIREPEHVSPGTAMPEQPMSPQDLRDIAAYLYTLKS